MNFALQYSRKVLSGKITAPEYVHLACQRFIDDLDRKDLTWDQEAANKVINFFEKVLRHWEGEWRGKPIKLELWQKFIFQNIFAWKYIDGRRRIRSVFIEVARKNSKTTMMAGLGLYHVLVDYKNSPQILVGANNEDQAKICTTCMAKIILQSPTLNELVNDGKLKLYWYREKCIGIEYSPHDGSVMPMTKTLNTKDGFNPSFGIIDEYHEAQTAGLLNLIETGQGARLDPLLAVITTAGFNKEGPCYSQLRKSAIGVLEGKLEDDHLFSVIYEPDEPDKWQELETWQQANPNYGISVYESYLKSQLTKALNEGKTKEVHFKTKNLNIWTDSADNWIQDIVWTTNTTGMKREFLIGKECYVGLDLAKKLDLNAMVLYFPEADKTKRGKIINAILCFFFMPEKKVRDIDDGVDYLRWVNEGFIELLGDFSIDFRELAPKILDILKNYQVKTIGFDRRFAYDGTIRSLIEQNYECVEVVQTSNYLNLPTTELEKMAVEGNLEHFNNPVLRWMIGNVALYTDTGGLVRPDKAKSQNKIDGVAALINAIFVNLAENNEPVIEPNIEFW